MPDESIEVTAVAAYKRWPQRLDHSWIERDGFIAGYLAGVANQQAQEIDRLTVRAETAEHNQDVLAAVVDADGQLDRLEAEVARLRPVVEAAREWRRTRFAWLSDGDRAAEKYAEAQGLLANAVAALDAASEEVR